MSWFSNASKKAGSIADAGLIGIGGIPLVSNLPFGFDAYVKWKNYKAQQEQQQYERELQERIFAREDNATYRRYLDLLESGLSPTLAAGSAAGAGSIVPSRAPQMEPLDLIGKVTQMASIMQMGANIGQTQQQTQLLRQQENLSIQQEISERLRQDNITADTVLKGANSASAWYDLAKAKDAGVTDKNPSTIGRIAKDAIGVIGRVFQSPNQSYQPAVQAGAEQARRVESNQRKPTRTSPGNILQMTPQQLEEYKKLLKSQGAK